MKRFNFKTIDVYGNAVAGIHFYSPAHAIDENGLIMLSPDLVTEQEIDQEAERLQKELVAAVKKAKRLLSKTDWKQQLIEIASSYNQK